jgi:hypothetical protein
MNDISVFIRTDDLTQPEMSEAYMSGDDPNDSGWSNRSRLQCSCSRDASKQRGSIGRTSVRCNRSDSLCVYEGSL